MKEGGKGGSCEDLEEAGFSVAFHGFSFSRAEAD